METFSSQYLDELEEINPNDNYFISIWHEIKSLKIFPNKLLDIGCGTGNFSHYPKTEFNSKLYGVDGSKYALGLAEKKNIFERLILVKDFSTDRIKLPSATFDFCLCKDLLEHLLSPENVLKEINRLLIPGGYVLIQVPNHFSLFGRIKFLLKNDLDTFGYFPDANRWDYPHIRFYEHHGLKQLLAINGFDACADFSSKFPSLPGMGKIPFLKKIGMHLASSSPNNFAEAFTLLAKKNRSL